MKPGDRGDKVRQLQQALRDAADPLPRYGVDGDFGGETLAALRAYCEREGFAWDGGPVPDHVLASLRLVQRIPSFPAAPSGVRLYDLRAEQADPHPKSKVIGGRTLRRDPAKIDGIVLHQAGIKFDAPRGNKTELGLARRALGAACHAMAFDGFVAWTADPLWHIHHGDGFNPTTVGLEVDGLYPGTVGGKIKGKDGKAKRATTLTEGTIEAARYGVRMLVEKAAHVGAECRYIYAHRQADSWRQADPGEALWRAVVLDYAVPVLGLRTRPALSLPDPQGDPRRHGLPVPAKWDPSGVGDY